MKRFRALAALLGCFAVMMAGLPTVALAWAPSQAPVTGPETGQAVSGGLCSQHCPSCEGTPCPPEATHCTVFCVGVTPALGVAAFVLPIPPGDGIAWPHRLAALHGQAPPPDPSPPRL